MHSDEFWMQKALDLAVRGRYTASPNPCVGCVIVKDDQLIGQGFHLRAGTAHAEINALKNACRSVEGATVYVTLEPCSHYGRTPPCAKALVEAGVSRVVAAMKDPNPLVSGKGFKILRDNGIDVRFGVLEEQAEAINLEFLWRMRNALPYIRLKQAVSLDGNIALGNGASKWITGAQARMDVQICRARSNAILTTSRTVLADDPAMTVRRSELPELVVDNYPMDELRQPDLVVLDSKASVSPKARIFEERSRRVFLVVSSTSVISRCYPDNCTVITYDGVDGELAGLFRLLAADYSINDLWVEAGACLTNSLLRQNLFNEYIVYMAPKLLGRDGIHMNHLEQYFSLEQVPCFSFKQIEKIGDDLKIILEPAR